MAAYAIVNNEIKDEATYSEFREKVAAVVEAAGGRYLVRGGANEVIEGDWVPDRLVVIEFADAAAARAFFDSADFAALKEIRARSADANVVIVEGV